MLHRYIWMLLPMKNEKQKRNGKGRFLRVENPKTLTIRVTPEEKEFIEALREAERKEEDE